MNHDRERIYLVWGSVLLVAVALVGITLLLSFGDGTPPEKISGILLIVTVVSGVTNAVMLLSAGSSSAVLLTFGRVLLWSSSLLLLAAGVLAAIGMAS